MKGLTREDAKEVSEREIASYFKASKSGGVIWQVSG